MGETSEISGDLLDGLLCLGGDLRALHAEEEHTVESFETGLDLTLLILAGLGAEFYDIW